MIEQNPVIVGEANASVALGKQEVDINDDHIVALEAFEECVRFSSGGAFSRIFHEWWSATIPQRLAVARFRQLRWLSNEGQPASVLFYSFRLCPVDESEARMGVLSSADARVGVNGRKYSCEPHRTVARSG